MAFPISASLLDAVVLAIVAKDASSYGYKITQDVRTVMEVSESTLYPVLRRLQKEEYLETFDQEFQGRNRRYYKVTAKGFQILAKYQQDWIEYKTNINRILIGDEKQ
ncbi:MAG: PadR family transcriptional regulator [Treponema sp.]|nr:PadR family transcriptional regulator [Treponema sp.]